MIERKTTNLAKLTPGECLRFLRKQRGLTQKQLGASSSYSHVAISAIERNEMEPSPKGAKRLARALGVEPILVTSSNLTERALEAYLNLSDVCKLEQERPEDFDAVTNILRQYAKQATIKK